MAVRNRVFKELSEKLVEVVYQLIPGRTTWQTQKGQKDDKDV